MSQSETSLKGRPLKLAIIVGSTREGRAAPTVAEWLIDKTRHRNDIVVDLIDLADLDLPAVYPAQPGPAERSYISRIDQADCFLVVTPEYNHGYPASLKQAIDLPYKEWQAKPVGFVSYGGMSGGLRAVEQLRQVFAELHAVTVRDSVSLHNYWKLFGPADDRLDHVQPNAAAKAMLDQLVWWARVLRTARESQPYAA
jgi:NAD(P)H-dependent FMN reductase